jgi:hypothetical protein
MKTSAVKLETELKRIARATPWLMDVLDVVRAIGLPECYVAAGAIRNTVWNFLSGQTDSRPLGDIDVVYFDLSDDHPDAEAILGHCRPDYRWDVTNQATVHRWQSASSGSSVTGYQSVADALECWPETATAVGLRTTINGTMDIVAPFGLSDLFSMTVRPSPKLADPGAYRSRSEQKGWLDRWPTLRVLPLIGEGAV